MSGRLLNESDEDYKIRIINNWNSLKNKFARYNSFVEIISGEEMFNLMDKSEFDIISAMKEFKKKFDSVVK